MEAPFDATATGYDAEFTETAVGRLQRNLVWDFLSQRITEVPHQPMRVLELNCGTGEDAIWLGKQGCQVLATDISPNMIAVAQAKIERQQLSHCVHTQVCGINEIGKNILKIKPDFDLVFSNFGGLNCLSPADLARFGADLAQKLPVGGKFIGVVMGRFCWWEMFYFLLKFQPKKAFRRFSKHPIKARLDDQTHVNTWYFSPREFAQILTKNGPTLLCVSARPVGFWLPPSYLDPFFRKFPRLLKMLQFLEKNAAPVFFAHGADHFLIVIEKVKP